MTRRDARLFLGLSGAASMAGTVVFVIVSTADGRTLAPANVPWVAFPIVWWTVGAIIVSRAGGHLVGRILAIVGALAGALVGGLGFLVNPGLPAAPWAVLVVGAAYGPLFIATILGGIAVLGVVGAASVIWRFRRGDATVRAQLKWLLASVLPVVILTPLSYLAPVDPSTWSPAGFLSSSALLLVPVAIGVAMTRYHLYDIDRLISRGLAWATLTGLVFTVYATGVLVLQSALGEVTQGQTLAVAASTLVAAAVAQPLRIRLQRAMDRRFDRTRYDGDRVVGAFNDRLRGQIDLDSLSAEVRRVAGETVRPTSTALWLRNVPDRPVTAIS